MKRSNPARSVPHVLDHEAGAMVGDRSRTDFDMPMRAISIYERDQPELELGVAR